MGIYKNLKPEDVTLRSFQVHKEFTFTNNDSGSGVYGIRAISGSTYNFQINSTESQSFGEYNSLSASIGKEPYWATYYNKPFWNMIYSKFYYDTNVCDAKNVDIEHYNKSDSQKDSFVSISGSDFPDRLLRNQFQSRQLHGSASVITIPKEFYGEEIKPNSLTITDNSTNITYTLKDDGLGNIYDNNYSASYTTASESYDPASGQPSGSIIGNIMYGQGLIVITDTGSYKDVGNSSGAQNGWSLTFKSTQTIYEREIQCLAEKGEFLTSNNISLTPGYSGSNEIYSGLLSGSYGTQHKFLKPLWPASSSFKTITKTHQNGDTYTTNATYEGTSSFHDFASGSEFSPYITTIGLYDSNNELLAVGKLAKPIKNEKELDINFVLRFDV